MLAQEKLDAVVITTPRETHHLVVTLAARFGVHMFVEAPLASTRAMMDVIAEVEAGSKLKIVVGEQMWRRPAELLNRQAIAAGLIGEVIRVTSFYGPSGGDSCHHSMALMRHYAAADAVEIHGMRYQFPTETWTQGVVHYANGVIGSITYTSNWLAPIRRGHPRFLSIEGTNGFIITGDGPGHLLRRVEDGVPRDYPKQMELARDRSDQEYLVRCYYETDPSIEYRSPFGPDVAHDGDARSEGRIFDELARASELAPPCRHDRQRRGLRRRRGATGRRAQPLAPGVHPPQDAAASHRRCHGRGDPAGARAEPAVPRELRRGSDPGSGALSG
jgi:predicted dehydrogenase